MTSNTKSSLKGIGEWGAPEQASAVRSAEREQGETIHNLGINHTIKNRFGISILYQIDLELQRGEIADDSQFN